MRCVLTAVFASTRVRRASRPYAQAEGKTAPTSATMVPHLNFPATDEGAIGSSARITSRVTKNRTRYYASRAADSFNAPKSQVSQRMNVDVRDLLENLAVRSRSLPSGRPSGVRQVYRSTPFAGTEGFRHCARDFLS